MLHLCELVDFIFAPKFTKGMVAYLGDLISDHLTEFQHLYGHVCKLKPKHHFLVHMPTIILKNGPLVGMSCLWYEMKNSFFKKSVGVVCNFVNMCKTLTYHHQCNAFYLRLSKQYLRTFVTVGRRLSGCGPAAAYEFGDCVCSALGVVSMQWVYVAAKIQMASVKYC